MKPGIARKLALRLLLVQMVVCFVTQAVVTAFAPKLLLEPAIAEGNGTRALYLSLAIVVCESIATFALLRPLRPGLDHLGEEGHQMDPRDVLTLYAIPAKLALLDVLASIVLLSVTILPPLRPDGADWWMQFEHVLLAATMTSVAALPAYVALRGAVARILELVSASVSRDAIAILELSPPPLARVRLRLLLAVALPVAFVALGCSLLVLAHVRVHDARLRDDGVAMMVRASLGLVDGSSEGRSRVVPVAATKGVQVALATTPCAKEKKPDASGGKLLTVPLEDGCAVVRLAPQSVTPEMMVYVVLTLVVVVIAAFTGSRMGVAFASDVAIVTREVRNLGAADVIRGTRVQRATKFTTMGALMKAIDELGGIFREFASTQERAIEARAANERMRGLFLASMSHDLKAPLNAILGFAELASRNPLAPSQRESLAIIEQRGRELLHLIETILDAARVEAGELVIAPESTIAGEVVMGAVVDARALVGDGDIDIVAEIHRGLPRIYADRIRLTQALTSVILTGARFAEQGLVRVQVSYESLDRRFRVSIIVPGSGVPDGDLGKIFEAFKEPEQARKHGSLGLGLSLARSIIELHGGNIEASASSQSHTEFTVWLPLPHRSPLAGSSPMGLSSRGDV